MDSLVGGFGFLSAVFQYIFPNQGFHLTALLLLFYQIIQRFQLGRSLYASIHIDRSHDLYPILLRWASHKFAQSSTLKLAPLPPQGQGIRDGTNPLGIHNPRTNVEIARVEPYFGTYMFSYKNRLFFFRREQINNAGPFRDRPSDETITLWTLGWSSTALKDLLQMIASEEDEEEQRTTVWIPRTSMERRYFGAWKKHKQRPFRSWNTVILPGKKDELLADISDYLNPGTARWYASKGIPWRRGYLFSGAPGSGKTSLALALAGKLGLDIYIVKLGNPDLGDSDLEELLGDLPQRSLVLLEDIDAAGIGQRRADRKQAELEPFGKETTQQLTLAGLLSAIDGITSNQGRILVMTTNVANSLDAALRRPGQIDVEVEFTLTTKEQIHGIFSHIYEGFRNVNTLATRFANQFPEKTYSAAETQEFLIQRKDTPAQAVEDVGKWHRAMLKKNNTAKEQKGISL